MMLSVISLLILAYPFLTPQSVQKALADSCSDAKQNLATVSNNVDQILQKSEAKHQEIVQILTDKGYLNQPNAAGGEHIAQAQVIDFNTYIEDVRPKLRDEEQAIANLALNGCPEADYNSAFTKYNSQINNFIGQEKISTGYIDDSIPNHSYNLGIPQDYNLISNATGPTKDCVQTKLSTANRAIDQAWTSIVENFAKVRLGLTTSSATITANDLQNLFRQKTQAISDQLAKDCGGISGLSQAVTNTTQSQNATNSAGTKLNSEIIGTSCGCDANAGLTGNKVLDALQQPLNQALCSTLCLISTALGGLACYLVQNIVDPLFADNAKKTCDTSTIDQTSTTTTPSTATTPPASSTGTGTTGGTGGTGGTGSGSGTTTGPLPTAEGTTPTPTSIDDTGNPVDPNQGTGAQDDPFSGVDNPSDTGGTSNPAA